MDATRPDPRTVIERAAWRHGVVGDACARLAAAILEDLDAAGWAIVPAPTDG
jgi:hypothetical protein